MKRDIWKHKLLPATLAVLLWNSGCGHKSEAPSARETSRPTVTVSYTEVKMQSEPQYLQLTGTLKSRRDTTLYSKLSGRITYLRVEEGDPVGSGEVVVQIDTSDIAAQAQQAQAGESVALASQSQAQVAIAGAQAGVAQANAQIDAAQRQLKEMEARRDLAKKEHERQSFLAREGAVPRQRADQALTDYKVALAQVEQSRAAIEVAKAGAHRSQTGVSEARAAVQRSAASVDQARSSVSAASVNLDYGQLRAPFAGVVVKKMAYEGEVASPGKALVQIQDRQSLELSLNVPESQMDKIHLRQRLDVEIPSASKTYRATVRQIVASTDPASRTFEARLQLEDQQRKLLPGMFGRVKLAQESKNRLLIPTSSLVQRGGLQGVFVVGERAEFRLVKTGESQKDRVEVLSGLAANEKLILKPPAELQEGSPIQASAGTP